MEKPDYVKGFDHDTNAFSVIERSNRRDIYFEIPDLSDRENES